MAKNGAAIKASMRNTMFDNLKTYEVNQGESVRGHSSGGAARSSLKAGASLKNLERSGISAAHIGTSADARKQLNSGVFGSPKPDLRNKRNDGSPGSGRLGNTGQRSYASGSPRQSKR